MELETSAIPDHVFRSIVDRTAVPYVLIDGSGVIRYASRSVSRVLGIPREEGLGRNVLEFLDEDDGLLAMQGLAEITSEDHVAAGIPVILPIRRPDGGTTWAEVAAMPLFDAPELGLISLRIRPWNTEHHLGVFMEQLLADAPLGDVLTALTASATSSLYAVATAVHHGWDGERFMGVAGSWPGAADLPLTGRPWVDALDHDGVLELPGDLLGTTSCWLMRVGGGNLAPAVLSVWTDSAGIPMLGHRSALATVARYVELAIVRTSEHQRLEHLAGHDALTGVPNRAAFRDHLARALAIGEWVAVGFCDLDGFKQLNDTHGHGAGDDVLVQVADRLRRTLRGGDELARMGGDEFTVLWRGIGTAAEAQRVADRLVATIEEPFRVPGGTATLGISVGVALGAAGANADDLLASADAALYKSKRLGGRRATIGT